MVQRGEEGGSGRGRGGAYSEGTSGGVKHKDDGGDESGSEGYKSGVSWLEERGSGEWWDMRGEETGVGREGGVG